MNSSCVKQYPSSYSEITHNLKTFTPSVIVKQNNGIEHDIQITKITGDHLIGYINKNDSVTLHKIPKSSILSLSQKKRTKLASRSIKATQTLLIGVAVIVLLAAGICSLLDDYSDDSCRTHY